MGFKDLLGGGKQSDERRTTDDELNTILAPVRDQIADFKDRTKMSYVHLIPAINSVGVKLLVKSRGLESTQRLYRAMINDFDAKGGIPVGSHTGANKPPVRPEDIAELNDMLWRNANNMIARGTPLEHVGQAYTALAMLLSERAASGDPWMAKFLLAEAARELKVDFKGLNAAQAPQAEQSAENIQCPDDAGEPTRTLFNLYRDFIHLFRDKSGLDWEHLLPGIQAGATVYFIKDRGKARTLELFESQIDAITSNTPQGCPKEFLPRPITPLHTTNMAKFNEAILQMSESFAKDSECPPVFIGHALALLVVAISYRHFDQIRCAAALASACEDIRQGRFDKCQ